MDILNWLYLAKNKFVRTTLSSTKDLMIFGAKVGFTKRGDKYQNYAMSAEDFTTGITNIVKPYKVYTALLTQSGGDNIENIGSGELTIGVTYRIINPWPNSDFTNVGAPNNDQETYFVATGTIPNNWGTPGSDDVLEYNTGAPVVTVLENTIGNVWFTYGNVGNYNVNSDGLFIENKQYLLPYTYYNDNGTFEGVQLSYNNNSSIYIFSQLAGVGANDMLSKTPIEIRVYN